MLLGGCLLGAGCESLPHLPLMARRAEPEAPAAQSVGWRERIAAPFHHAPAPSSPDVLQPQSVVYWSAVPGAGGTTKGYRGRSTVNADGNIDLGPYGSVHVAGMTPDQAKAVVTRQVASQVRDPRVTLSLLPPAREGEMVAHQAGAGVQRTGHVAAAGPGLNDGNGTPTESRLVPSPNGPLAITPTNDGPFIQEPPASPDLPFPRTVNGHPVVTSHGPFPVGTGSRAPNEVSMVPMPPYVIGITDILLIEYKPSVKLAGKQAIAGQHLVNPDGTVHLGVWGEVRVAGLTLAAARQAIVDQIRPIDNAASIENVNVDILAYNSKKYYVITDGAGYGEQVYTFPITGNDTVLDAISHIGGLPAVSSKRHIWVARRNPSGGFDNMLPVDWIGVTQRAATPTNYQIMPGDRVYVYSDKWRRADTNVQKVLSPFERILGATLLGASTVQEIRLNPSGGTGGTTGR
jgi:polysaccharide export outer membrane protein